MADDDRAVRERMAALEAEVKADADAQRARKEAAMQKLRAQQAEQADLRRRQQALVSTKKAPAKAKLDDDDDDENNLGSALELAGKANRVKNELTKTRKKGEKSWMISGVASMALGPLGWLYAGSLRESIPASAIWVLLATVASKILPAVLLMPVLMVALPLSGIAGVVYALQYNRTGSRQRLFDKDKDQKQLKSGS
ncbi:MAG: hypothetical protein QM831_22910 [Kofleriaceae bacterium]